MDIFFCRDCQFTSIPDKTKLMMQDQWIKELQAQLTKSDEIQNTVIQFVAREAEALDQRLSEKMDELLVATCSVGDTFKAINARFETIDKINEVRP
ncbi:hypothetical protein [Endozoicomonas sp. SCSIO W0465]|uniref:hypothetical protein n=1 Tax=Endozoicomonas sp. SCSIO W0465 TaxID=2918516 RepID=UPI002075866F|nr:hypothetical protein [Endozoicomonas sp. SCSIO W0465]USE36294.1 hypothetical protein MJO57_30425 [Endozoicomonas sp. SCSIO W0465]